MTGRERILATLNRQRPDRVAFDIAGTDCSAVHVLTYQKLRDALGVPQGPIKCGCLIQLVAEPEEAVNQALGVDAEALWFGSEETKIWKTPFGPELIVPEKFAVEDLPDGSSVVRNAEGTVCFRRSADAYYFDPVYAPLGHITKPEELDQYDAMFDRWDYAPLYDEPIEALAERARKQYESTDRAVVGLWRMHYMQGGQISRGFENFFMDLAADKKMVHALMGKLHEAYMRRLEVFLAAFGQWIDVAFLTDDLGTQNTGQISPDTYRELIYPYISEAVARIKAAGKKVVMHSCGAVSSFIPSFIEMGVDGLNPVQVSAGGMNPRDLVREYGRDIAFWGGGCDTQHAMNAADPETVRADVRRRLDEYGPDAHLVFTQVHNIQYDVPPENILAMRDEFRLRTGG
ncbi:MAG: hypothetical protein HQ581_14585 [Planctomycetes bacterium]|nr:hypothetical protein [Planctomycetota bacterium]